MSKVMIKKLFLFAFLFVCCVFCGFLSTGSAFAHPIEGVKIGDYDYWDQGDVTYFNVSVEYDSTNYTCRVTDKFHCIDPNWFYLRPEYYRDEISYTVKDKGSGDYEVTIGRNPNTVLCDKNDICKYVQRARGTVHCDHKDVDLTVYAITDSDDSSGTWKRKYLYRDGSQVKESDWRESAPTNAVKLTKAAGYNSGVDLNANSFNNTGNYEFDHWGAICGGSKNKTCKTGNIKADGEGYVYFKLKQHTLTVYAVTEVDKNTNKHKYLYKDGNQVKVTKDFLDKAPTNAIKLTKTVNHGDTVGLNAGGFDVGDYYTFNHWGSICGNIYNTTACTTGSIEADGNGYAFFKLRQHVLIVYAITGARQRANGSWQRKYLIKQGSGKIVESDWRESIPTNVIKLTKTVNHGDTVGLNADGFGANNYTFNQWGAICNSSKIKTCTTGVITTDKIGYAYFKQYHTLTVYAITDSDDSSGTWKRKYLYRDGSQVKESGWRESAPINAVELEMPVDNGQTVNLDADEDFYTGNYGFVKWGMVCPDSTKAKCTTIQINGDYVGYVYFGLKKATLTAYAMARTGNGDIELNNGKSIDHATVTIGANAKVNRTKYNPGSGYTWWKWGAGGVCKDAESNDDCTAKLTKDESVNAYWYRNEFEGQSRVSEVDAKWENIPDNKKATTGWTQQNGKTVIHSIQNCDPEKGCNVRFDHWLRIAQGSGFTSYRVYRESNRYTIQPGAIVEVAIKRLPDSKLSDSTKDRVSEESYTLYPGQVVCESLTFVANVDVKNVSIKVCALALGDAQPKNEDGSSTLLKMEVSKDGGENYTEGAVYMKPGDKVKFRATYNPVLQYTYKVRAEQMRINTGTIFDNQKPCNTLVPSSEIKGYCNLYEFFNAKKGDSLEEWNNAFTLSKSNSNFAKENRDGDDTEIIKERVYAIGTTTKRELLDSYGRVAPISGAEAGSKMTERIKINQQIKEGGKIKWIESTATTPSQVTFTRNGNKNLGNVQTEPLERRAHAYVPYNFKNTTELTGLADGGEIVYAGEGKTINFNVNVGKRLNNVTGGDYATIVRDAKVQLIMCEGDGCTAGNENPIEESKILNVAGVAGGYSDPLEIGVTIPDVEAGSRMCFKSRVYPSTVNNDTTVDTDWKTNTEDYVWEESEERCYTVAKKPSFQVWGGDLGIDGDARAAVSNKKKLAGYEDGTHIFGSWTELGLIVGGKSTGIASGASTGYNINYGDSTLWPAVTPMDGLGNNASIDGRSPGGGIDVSNFCKRSVLSLANGNCSGGSVGFGGSSSGGSTNHLGIIADLISDEIGDVSSMNLSEDGGASYYYQSGDVTIGSATVRKGNTKLVRSDGNINIVGNIEYEDAAYSAIEDIPKLVVYAGGDIVIDCKVSRIDAILISENTVHTCNDVSVNARERSTQLRINGSIVANKLDLGRTYGAATGANSMVPAEIINYDSSVYLWANRQTDITTTSSSKLVEAYMHELSPRY